VPQHSLMLTRMPFLYATSWCCLQEPKKRPLTPSHWQPGETRSRTVLRLPSKGQLLCRIMQQPQEKAEDCGEGVLNRPRVQFLVGRNWL